VGFFDYCIPLTNESKAPTIDSLKKFYDYSVYDYITPPPEPRHINQSMSVFVPHNLTTKHSSPLSIAHQSTDWITLIFVLCLFVLAWIQSSYSKRLSQIYQAVAQPHHMNQLEREGNLFKERITLGLSFIYYTVTAVFVFLIFREYTEVPVGLSDISFTGIILTVLFILQMLKSGIVYLTGIIFDTREAARQYQLNILIFNDIIGITLFPIAITAFYWNSILLLTFGIVIVSLLLIYRLFRGILTGLENKSYNLFYLFLYLCTLEILPLLLIFKAISTM